MKARNLLEQFAHGPESLKVLGKAFDDAWLTIAPILAMMRKRPRGHGFNWRTPYLRWPTRAQAMKRCSSSASPVRSGDDVWQRHGDVSFVRDPLFCCVRLRVAAWHAGDERRVLPWFRQTENPHGKP